MRCTKCDGEMKVIALIQDRAVVRRILDHLGLWPARRGDERGTAPHTTRVANTAEPWVYEPVDDGWPGWDHHETADPMLFDGLSEHTQVSALLFH